VLLPTGRPADYGDRPGIQVNLPISKQIGDFYVHGNAGFTRLFGVTSLVGPAVIGFEPETRDLTSPTIAGSVIYRVAPMFNVMLESGIEFVDDFGQSRPASVLLSPGFRAGWNLGDRQLVVGAAVPVTRYLGDTSVAVLGYFSYELPYRSGN
jgi:hypothetical protein